MTNTAEHQKTSERHDKAAQHQEQAAQHHRKASEHHKEMLKKLLIMHIWHMDIMFTQ